MGKWLYTILVLSMLASPALADDDDITFDDEEETPKKDDTPYDGPPPKGSDEDPGAPTLAADKEKLKQQPKVKVKAPETYPQRFVDRPLIFPNQMAEISFESPVTFNEFSQTSLLGVSYSVTPRVQIDLDYGVGTYNDGGFTTGKAISLGTRVLIRDWVSVEMRLPLLFDPFAMGVSLGAPMLFRITDKVNLYVGHDLLSFKVAKFVPSEASPVGNEGLAAAEAVGTKLPDGDYRINIAAGYQLSDASLFLGEISVIAPDFGIDSALYGLDLTYLYAFSNKFDVSASLASGDLQNVDTNLTLTLGVFWRL